MGKNNNYKRGGYMVNPYASTDWETPWTPRTIDHNSPSQVWETWERDNR